MKTIAVKGNLIVKCKIVLTGGGKLLSFVPESKLPADALLLEGDTVISGSLQGPFNFLVTGNIIQEGG